MSGMFPDLGLLPFIKLSRSLDIHGRRSNSFLALTPNFHDSRIQCCVVPVRNGAERLPVGISPLHAHLALVLLVAKVEVFGVADPCIDSSRCVAGRCAVQGRFESETEVGVLHGLS